MLRGGSRSFFAASLLLPSSAAHAATGLYAFCRVADDAVDFAVDKPAALAELRERLDRIYAQQPLPEPADRAFADVVARFEVPKALPAALLEGFEWDAEERRYDDISGIYAYSARVAGTVGVMMTLLMGVRDPFALARACDLGVAMQLTNIARDVGEDAHAGRIYLPLEWLREAGIEPATWLARPRFSAALAEVVQRLLDTADWLYQRAESGIGRLPWGCRPGIYAARFVYAEIGRELERCSLDSVNQRAITSTARKAQLLGKAVGASFAPPTQDLHLAPLDETSYLIEAVAKADHESERRKEVPWWALGERWGWAMELFSRLDSRVR